MGFAENFEDLQIWQRSRVLTNAIYNAFEKIRDFEFRSQIQRASVSVMNNIAEGFERRTKKDFAHFLDLSKGSSGEVRSMLYLAEDRRYIDKSAADSQCEREGGRAPDAAVQNTSKLRITCASAAAARIHAGIKKQNCCSKLDIAK